MGLSLALASTGVVAVAEETAVVVVPSINADQVKMVLSKTRRDVFEAGMELPAANKDAFWNVYAEFEKEKQALDDRRISVLQQYASKKDQLTNEQAMQLVNDAAGVAKKEIDLRSKYTKKLGKVIPGGLAARFYQIDAYITTAWNLDLLDSMELLGHGE